MGLTVSHSLSMTTPDNPAYENQPKHWNSAHAFTMNAVGSEISNAFGNGGGVTFGYDGTNVTASAPSGGGGITNINVSAGTTSQNLSRLTFADSNGISFGLNGSVITGTVATNYQSQGAYLTTAMASNRGSDFMGTNTALTANGVSMTANSSGLSLNFPAFLTTAQSPGAYLTTARASNDGIGTNTALTAGPLAWTANSAGLSLNAGSAAGTTSGFGGNLISGSMTHNTAGLNLSLNHPAWLTTAMASNAATLSNIRLSAGTTSNLASAFTFGDGNGISFGLNAGTITGTVATNYQSQGAYLTTAMASNRGSDFVQATAAFAGTNASGTIASNGISISVAAPGGGGAINVSAGTTSGNLQTIEFANSNGVSFGLDGSTITASAAAGAGGGVALAAGGATVSDSTVIFSNSNNITFGLNGSTMTASYADPTESLFWRPKDFVTTVGAPINASASIIYCPLDHNLSASRFDLLASINVTTVNNNSSAGVLYTITAVIYTRNAGTLSSLSSVVGNNQMTWSSNATGSVTGAFRLSVPLNVNAVADKYWIGVQLSTRATGLTGAATTSLGNTFTMMGVGSAQVGAFSAREPGAGTANSNGWFSGMGMYSGTSNFSTIGFSNLTQQGTNMQRADVAVRMVNV